MKMTTNILLKLSLALACVVALGGIASAGTLTASATTPTVDGADIAQLNVVGHTDPGGDPGHIWSNRPNQGQTFTTGGNGPGYLLNSVALRNEENTVNNNTATFTVRIGTVSGTTFTPVATETSNVAVSYVPDDFMTFAFDTPVALSPNTLYAFDWATTGSGFTTWNNVNTEYAGGEGFSSGANGAPDDANLIFRGIDREFHIDMAAQIPEPSSLVLAALGLVAMLGTVWCVRRRQS